MASPSELLGIHPDAARKVLAGKGKKLHAHEAHVRRTKNGGYVIRHDLRDKQGNPPMDGQRMEEEYALPDKEAMLAHMGQHMGDEPGNGDDEEEEEGEQPPPTQ